MTRKKPAPAKAPAGGEAVPEKKKGGAPALAQQALDTEGLESICARVCDGETLTGIAHSLDVSFGSLQTWLEAVPERSARVKEARRRAARMWDEKALKGIEEAADAFALAKAKEAAHHLRWRASKIAPADYGDRQAVELSGKDGGPIQTQAVLTPEERAKRIRELAPKAGFTLQPEDAGE
jgi:hypothetical protein